MRPQDLKNLGNEGLVKLHMVTADNVIMVMIVMLTAGAATTATTSTSSTTTLM